MKSVPSASLWGYAIARTWKTGISTSTTLCGVSAHPAAVRCGRRCSIAARLSWWMRSCAFSRRMASWTRRRSSSGSLACCIVGCCVQSRRRFLPIPSGYCARPSTSTSASADSSCCSGYTGICNIRTRAFGGRSDRA